MAAPRYTSYPSVPHWRNDVDAADLGGALAAVVAPLGVYVHVPFCWEQCWYCGCNMVVSRRQGAGERYLRAMRAQIDALPLPSDPMPLARLHLGGGTPTWLAPDQLDTLFAALWTRFAPVSGAELSIEVHPGVTSGAHLDVLARHGFTRISIGVQSTDPEVLAAIGRAQSPDQVCAIAQGARDRGFTGLNLDLVYGLPRQTTATVDRTLDLVAALGPDRLAVYGYAHLPWLRPNQAKIDGAALPDPATREALFDHAAARLAAEGWTRLGMDHFARHGDPLAVAFRQRRLSRDFMGYTDRTSPLLGLGPSAISELGPLYAQQPAHLGRWYRAVEGGDPLPVARGHRLTEDDEVRRAAIRDLMCHLRGRRPFPPRTEARLGPWADRGAIAWTDDGFEITDSGRRFLREIAACYDAWLDRRGAPWRQDPRATA